ncbi:conserved hypothetical protein [Ricinus communis]|uniref:Uncharacterized protein n=1 Tax=Ricinus communis TaxID=3988 RepID=B9TK88_RICCO|nr:conserved hypothetical protein [Ricinus communis]
MRYINYYARDEQIVHAPVVSAFDLLYREYDQSLARLNARLRSEDSRYKSEQIVAQLLREVLSTPVYQALMVHDQVKLNQVAAPSNPNLTDRERAFTARATRHRASNRSSDEGFELTPPMGESTAAAIILCRSAVPQGQLADLVDPPRCASWCCWFVCRPEKGCGLSLGRVSAGATLTTLLGPVPTGRAKERPGRQSGHRRV